jgi:hypothetical protein
MGKASEARVQMAIALAASEYSPWEWHELPQGHRSGAIYRELRKLDAAAYRRRQTEQSQTAVVETEGTGLRQRAA